MRAKAYLGTGWKWAIPKDNTNFIHTSHMCFFGGNRFWIVKVALEKHNLKKVFSKLVLGAV